MWWPYLADASVKVRQLPQGRLAVRGAAGVVGAVDEHGSGVFVHQSGKGIKVDLEIRAPGRCDPQCQARALDIGLVLGKEGAKVTMFCPGTATQRMAWASAPAAPVVIKIWSAV